MNEPLLLTNASLLGTLVRDLCVTPPPSNFQDGAHRILCEMVRETLVEMSINTEADGCQPVHIHALLASVRKRAEWLTPREFQYTELASQKKRESDTPLETVHALTMVDDIAHLRHGFYLPSPTRFIDLDGATFLVVGSKPTRQMIAELGCDLMQHGTSRTGITSSLPHYIRDSRMMWQKFSNWLGEPNVPLEDWCRNLLEEARQNLQPSASEVQGLELYLPRMRRNQGQYFRYVRADQLSICPEGLVLCRYRTGTNAQMVYALGKFAQGHGGVNLKEEASVDSATVTRLQYGIDMIEGCSTTMRVEIDGTACNVVFRNELPTREKKLLQALSRDVATHGKRYPIKRRLGQNEYPTLKSALTKLGIGIEQRTIGQGGTLNE